MGIRQLWELIKASVTSWIDDYAPSMGAALAYYTLFSIAPLLLIVIAIAGFFFGAEAVRGEILGQLQGLMGSEGARAVQSLIESVSQPEKSLLATVIGVLLLVIGATSVFSELQTDLDRIWRVPERDKNEGLWALLRARLLSFGMILGLAFLLLVSLVLSAALAALEKWWGPAPEGWELFARLANFIIGFGLATTVFAMIYKIMPRAQIRWRDVWIGAAVTALLFSAGKFLIGLYIGESGVTSGFGTAGSLVAMLVWVYYSAQIFLLGAEFTWVYCNTYGSCKQAGRTEGEAHVRR